MKRVLKQDLLKAFVTYEPDTGLINFNHVDSCWFVAGRSTAEKTAEIWNAQCAGKPAFNSLHKSGYLHGSLLGKTYVSHRIAFAWMTGEWPEFIDHKNGIRNDNRWCNLREATRIENNRNAKFRSDNTTGFKGVTYLKANNKYQAQLGHFGKNLYLGIYDTAEEAFEAYCKKAKELEFDPRHIGK